MPILESYIFNPQFRLWTLIALSAITLSLVLIGFRFLVLRKFRAIAEASTNKIDDILLAIFESSGKVFLFFLSLYTVINFFHPGFGYLAQLHKIFFLLFCCQLCIWANSSIALGVKIALQNDRSRDPARATTIGALVLMAKIVLWITIGLLALNNLGVNVSALIAGLGIGGIAVALAVQNVLGDLLASLSIVLDRPFVIGDNITVGVDSGIVEHIGLKTTRLRSTSGEQLIFSNSDLLKSRIRNFKRMPERKVSLILSLSTNSSATELAKLPLLIKPLFQEISQVSMERCQLARISPTGLDLEINYVVHSSEPNAYFSARHDLNLKILALLKEHNIPLATPSTIFTTSPEANA